MRYWKDRFLLYMLKSRKFTGLRVVTTFAHPEFGKTPKKSKQSKIFEEFRGFPEKSGNFGEFRGNSQIFWNFANKSGKSPDFHYKIPEIPDRENSWNLWTLFFVLFVLLGVAPRAAWNFWFLFFVGYVSLWSSDNNDIVFLTFKKVFFVALLILGLWITFRSGLF